MGKRVNKLFKVTCGWMPARVALAVMSFLGFVNLYMVRINLSIIIVAMVGDDASTTLVSACSPHLNINNGSLVQGSLNTSQEDHQLVNSSSQVNQLQEGELDWSHTVQGVVLGSFYYGYAITQVLGGRAAEMYGSKLVFGFCILTSSLATFLIPWAAKLHFGLVIALRILQGIFQGVSWPAMHVHLSRWVPPLERPRFIAYVYFGTNLSIAMTLPLCGVIIEHYGWEAAFYLTGFPSLLWCLAWFTLTSSSPTDHPRISEKEKAYIITKVQESGTDVNQSKKRNSSVPWRSMATSRPFWAIIVHGLGNSWGMGILYSQLPTYMKNVLGFSIKTNGALSALPFLSRYVGAIIWSSLLDYCTSRHYLSVHTSRRIACSISMWLPGVFMLCLAYNGCGWNSAIGLMCAALFCNGAVTAGYFVNFTDIAPNFSGTLFGVDGTFYSLEAFVAPVVVGMITEGQQTLGQWRKVFWTCVPMYALSGLFFLMFSSVSVQPWNALRETENDGDAQGENKKNEFLKKTTIQSKANINYDVLSHVEAEEDLETRPNSEHQKTFQSSKV